MSFNTIILFEILLKFVKLIAFLSVFIVSCFFSATKKNDVDTNTKPLVFVAPIILGVKYFFLYGFGLDADLRQHI